MTHRRTLALCTATACAVGVPTVAAMSSGASSNAVPAVTTSTLSTATSPPTAQREAEEDAAGGGAGSNGSRSSAPASYSAPALPQAVDPKNVTTITPTTRFSVDPTPTVGKRPDATWPDAAEVFSQTELTEVIPGLTAVKATGCRPNELSGGRETTHAARCELLLTIKGEPASRASRLIVNISGFGTPEEIGTTWSTRLAKIQQKSTNTSGRYSYYRNGSLGVSSAFTDGTTARVLLQRPGSAGEIWFSGVGFTTLKSTYSASRADFRDRITPALVKLLGAKMAPAPR